MNRLRRRIRRLEEEISLLVPHSEEWLRLQDELAEASTELAALRAASSQAVERSADRELQSPAVGETLSTA